MLPALALALLIQNPTMEGQLTREARFLRDLPSGATWAQVKTALKGAKFEYAGFQSEEYRIGNLVKFKGQIQGQAVLISRDQAAKYNAWKADRKAVSFPAFPPSGSDTVSFINVDLGMGNLAAPNNDREYQQRLKVVLKEWGAVAVEPWSEVKDGGFELQWKSLGLSYVDDWAAEPYNSFDRDFHVKHLPAFEEGVPVAATKADHAALSAAMAGKSQSRLCITSGQKYSLKGCRLQPFGKPYQDWGMTEDYLLALKDGYVNWLIGVSTFNGKRLIRVMAPAG